MLTPEMELSDTRIEFIRTNFSKIIYRYYGEKVTERLLADMTRRLKLFLLENRFNVFVDVNFRVATGLFELVQIEACFPEQRGVRISIT